MTEAVSPYDVFTPTKPARLTFVEREGINDRLVNALRTPGKQLVVYGHSGSGKTTLLVNKLHQLYDHHITTRCVSGLTFGQLVGDAFDQLGACYRSETTSEVGYQVSGEVCAEYHGAKAKIGATKSARSTQKRQSVLSPQITPQTLGRFLGAAGCCWVLEDFHKIDSSEKPKLSQTMKVFMDLADEYPALKIIALGAAGTARQVIDYDKELSNRVSEIQVPLMNTAELTAIVTKGEGLLNFSISPSTRDEIVKYSNGLAAVGHSLCLNICHSCGIEERLAVPIEVRDEKLGRAIKLFVEDASDTLKSNFDRALRIKKKSKYDNCRLVLRALLNSTQDGATRPELLKSIRGTVHDYPAGNLSYFLDQLQGPDRGSMVRYDSASGRFSFRDPLHRSYGLVVLGEGIGSRSRNNSLIGSDRIHARILELINTTVKEFSAKYIAEAIDEEEAS